VLVVIAVIFMVISSKSTKKLDEGMPGSLYEEAQDLFKEAKYDKATEAYLDIIEKYPDYENIANVYYNLATSYSKQERFLKAKESLELIIDKYSDSDIIENVQKDLEDINMKVLFSPVDTKDSVMYAIKKGDTLDKIAKKYNTTVGLLKRSNGLVDDTIFPGKELKVVTSKFSILVVVSQRMLVLKLNDKMLRTYKISVGKGDYNFTPVGEFTIINKLVDPVWYKNGKVYPSENPENILGTRWLGLSKKGYGIHGTTKPESIGQSITQGCVRMYEEDIRELYSIVPVGTIVKIVE